MNLKRIRYYTMNSCNLSTAPAYNLKIYNVIPKQYQDKVWNLWENGLIMDEIKDLIRDFDSSTDYKFQAEFNGHSAGYLVLYHGGKIEDGQIFTQPGKPVLDKEVPKETLKNFKKLATDIVKLYIYYAKNYDIVEKEITVPKKYLTLEKRKSKKCQE